MKMHVRTLVFFAVAASAAAGQSLYEEVNLAIERGMHELLIRQNGDGTFANPSPGDAGLTKTYPMGITALATYALLKSGVPAHDPVITRAILALRYMPFKKTYSVSLLIMALDALQDPDKDGFIKEAAEWLEFNLDQSGMLWGYPEGTPDMSNTQYAALALWKAEQHGYRVQKRTWANVANGVLKRQTECGGFGYRHNLWPETHGTMTTAGITVLSIVIRHLEGSPKKRVEKALEESLAYFDRSFTTTGNFYKEGAIIKSRFPSNRRCCFHFYYLYGIERAGALSNRTEFGGRNWYMEGAQTLLKLEVESGGWGDLVNTSFALLFLRRATFSGISSVDGSYTTGALKGEEWKYTTEDPGDGWFDPIFDDSGWGKGKSCLGNIDNDKGVVRTVWDTDDVWIRREFTWRKDTADEFRLFALHDDGLDIYINGVKAVDCPEWNQAYEKIEVSPEALATVKKGKNLLAAHCTDIGGASIVDVSLHDIGNLASRADESEEEAAVRWWKNRPLPRVPYIRRWLVLGPFNDHNDSLLLDPVPRGDEMPGDRVRAMGSMWRAYTSPVARLSFDKAGRVEEHSVHHAFTYLKAKKTTDAVLWVGADDGIQVLLNGRVVFCDHSHKASAADTFSIPLRLTEGVHSLRIKVENHTGASHLYARLATREGDTASDVHPVLSADSPVWAEVARACPELFSLEELMNFLEPDVRNRLEFHTEKDLQRMVVTRAAVGYPLWVRRYDNDDPAPKPHPGAKGVIALKSVNETLPVRLFWKVHVPFIGKRFEAKVCPDVAAGEAAGFSIRLGVYSDGSLVWHARQEINGGARPFSGNWHTIGVAVEEYADRDVILVIECASTGGDFEEDCAFINEISLK